MELQIKVFTEPQAEAVKSLLNDELFDEIISEDSTGLEDDFVPSNYVWAIAPHNTDYYDFECKLQDMIPGFSFKSKRETIGSMLFTAHPVWAAGRELVKEEFLSLFPVDQQKELWDIYCKTAFKPIIPIKAALAEGKLPDTDNENLSLEERCRMFFLDRDDYPVKEDNYYLVGWRKIKILKIHLYLQSTNSFNGMHFCIVYFDKWNNIIKSMTYGFALPFIPKIEMTRHITDLVEITKETYDDISVGEEGRAFSES